MSKFPTLLWVISAVLLLLFLLLSAWSLWLGSISILMSGTLMRLWSRWQRLGTISDLSLTLKPALPWDSTCRLSMILLRLFSLFNSIKKIGSPSYIVTDRNVAYKIPTKAIFLEYSLRVASFKDDISNNLIEAFNHQFKAWYKTKQGFNSFSSANNLNSTFVFFFNFVRPHSALHGLTPAQVAGLSLSKSEKRRFPRVV